ncbi:MAG: GntR family transcriptional regulator [Bacteroidia bacterium]
MTERTLQYQVLYNRLKREILSGVYEIGSVLPSENELCATANLARSTVRQALSQLETEGYIFKQKGKGSIVKSKSRALNILSFQGFSASVNADKISTLSVHVPTLGPWPDNFFSELSEMENNAGCVYFSRVRLLDGSPIMLEKTFVPNLNLPGFSKRFQVTASFFEFLGKQYQIEITGMDQEIRAFSATEEESHWLSVPEKTPLLKIVRKYYTNRPYLQLYSLLFCNTEKYAMSNSSGNSGK